MATKPGKVVTYNGELPSIKSHDPLIMWSSDFDFSYTIYRFKMQTSKLSPNSCCTYEVNAERTITNIYFIKKVAISSAYKIHEKVFKKFSHLININIYKIVIFDYQ